jgi:hypothetical protein
LFAAVGLYNRQNQTYRVVLPQRTRKRIWTGPTLVSVPALDDNFEQASTASRLKSSVSIYYARRSAAFGSGFGFAGSGANQEGERRACGLLEGSWSSALEFIGIHFIRCPLLPAGLRTQAAAGHQHFDHERIDGEDRAQQGQAEKSEQHGHGSGGAQRTHEQQERSTASCGRTQSSKYDGRFWHNRPSRKVGELGG